MCIISPENARVLPYRRVADPQYGVHQWRVRSLVLAVAAEEGRQAGSGVLQFFGEKRIALCGAVRLPRRPIGPGQRARRPERPHKNREALGRRAEESGEGSFFPGCRGRGGGGCGVCVALVVVLRSQQSDYDVLKHDWRKPYDLCLFTRRLSGGCVRQILAGTTIVMFFWGRTGPPPRATLFLLRGSMSIFEDETRGNVDVRHSRGVRGRCSDSVAGREGLRGPVL